MVAALILFKKGKAWKGTKEVKLSGFGYRLRREMNPDHSVALIKILEAQFVSSWIH